MNIGDWVKEQGGYYLGEFKNNQIFTSFGSSKNIMTWHEAMNLDLDDFGIPTKEELVFVYNQVKKFNLGKKLNVNYSWTWSSTDSPNTTYAEVLDFLNGYHYFSKKHNRAYVVVIRKVPISSSEDLNFDAAFNKQIVVELMKSNPNLFLEICTKLVYESSKIEKTIEYVNNLKAS